MPRSSWYTESAVVYDLARYGPSLNSAIRDRLQMNEVTLSACLHRLEKRGFVKRTVLPKKGHYVEYDLRMTAQQRFEFDLSEPGKFKGIRHRVLIRISEMKNEGRIFKLAKPPKDVKAFLQWHQSNKEAVGDPLIRQYLPTYSWLQRYDDDWGTQLSWVQSLEARNICPECMKEERWIWLTADPNGEHVCKRCGMVVFSEPARTQEKFDKKPKSV
jgi:hypothetical protein